MPEEDGAPCRFYDPGVRATRPRSTWAGVLSELKDLPEDFKIHVEATSAIVAGKDAISFTLANDKFVGHPKLRPELYSESSPPCSGSKSLGAPHQRRLDRCPVEVESRHARRQYLA